jgi:hypothetical protein
MCEVWTDHQFGRERVVGAGVHQVLGPYVRVVRTCGCCDKRTEETRWLNDAGARRLYHLSTWYDNDERVQRKRV